MGLGPVGGRMPTHAKGAGPMKPNFIPTHVHLETFGCQMNEYDSELVRSLMLFVPLQQPSLKMTPFQWVEVVGRLRSLLLALRGCS